MFQASVDISDVKRALDSLGKESRSMLRGVVNKTGKKAQSQSVKAAAALLKWKQKTVRPLIKLHTARAQYQGPAPSSLLLATGPTIPVGCLDAIETPAGVVYHDPVKGLTVIPSAFIATVRGGKRSFFSKLVSEEAGGAGHTAVFKREPLPSTRRSPGAWSRNLPIRQQRASGMAELVQTSGIFRKAFEDGKANLQKYLAGDLDFFLKRRAERRASRG